MLASLLVTTATASAGQVTLTDGRELADDQIASIDLSGVTLLGMPDAPIAWDEVLSVAGESAERAEQFAELHASCWRAATRLERGDWPAATPLFERLFDVYDGIGGPTASMVSEGRLRCALAAGDRLVAAESWLAWLATEPKQARFGGVRLMGEPTLLEPSLPPFDTNLWGVAGAEVNELAGLMEMAAPGSGSAAFMLELVESQNSDSGVREQARARLFARVEPTGDGPLEPWAEAWARVAIGRSMLLEMEPDVRMAGVVELLHVPALLADEQPALSALALADAAVALRSLGDTAGAATLRAELIRVYPLSDAAKRRDITDWPT